MHRDFATEIYYSLTQLGQAKLTLLWLYCCLTLYLINVYWLYWEKSIQQGVTCQFLAWAGSLKTCCDVQRLQDVTRSAEIVVCLKSSVFFSQQFCNHFKFFQVLICDHLIHKSQWIQLYIVNPVADKYQRKVLHIWKLSVYKNCRKASG